ncbi:MAG: NUMOD1 domain-containing DNA-binding protein [Flavobacterium sp.]
MEEHFDEKTAATRERELQKQYGYKVDNKEYNLDRFRFLQKKGELVTQKKYSKEFFGECGRIGGQINLETGHIQNLGKQQGKKNVETGHWDNITKLVNRKEAGRKGGLKNIETGHIHKLGKKYGKIYGKYNLTNEGRIKGAKKAGKISGKKAVDSGRILIMTEQAAAANRKKIIATNLDTFEITIFDSAKHAHKELNICSGYISKVCRGVYKKAKNYKFEYEKN